MIYSTMFNLLPFRWHCALGAALFFASRTLAATIEPAPMVLDPSQYWEGNDGPWSTFSIQIGDSKNISRVLVSTAIPNQWVVLQQACNTTACANTRGGNLLSPNKSSTWNDKGLFDLYYEANLNYTGNGDYGFDTVGLGLDPTQVQTATDQLVVGIVADDFWLGYLGVNPQATNLRNFSDPIPSLITSLRNNGSIPSISYSYTAGAKYRNKGEFGQLILGGYDTSKFQPNNISFNMARDVTRDLVVGVQSLQSQEANGQSKNLLSQGFFAYVDSTVPWIILPDDACDQIEQTFAISQDPQTGLYLISDTQHNALRSRNPSFTFVIGNLYDGGATVSITLPYASFDLQIGAPYVNSNDSTRYFPLRRGNETSYTLGRAFLQEAYLTANYEHQNFSISQALFDDGAQPSIQPLHALGYVAPPDASGSNDTSSSSMGRLPTAAIAGIIIAILIPTIAVVTTLILRRRNRRFSKGSKYGPSELDGDGNAVGYEKDGRSILRYIHQKPLAFDHASVVEADSKDSLHGYYRTGLPSTDHTIVKSELAGSGGNPTNRNELPGSHGANEIEGCSPVPVMELPGSPVGHEYLRRQVDKEPISAISNTASSPSTLISGQGSRNNHSPVSPRQDGVISPDITRSRAGRLDFHRPRRDVPHLVSPQSPSSSTHDIDRG